jgi:hypothetical protein
MSTIPCAWAVNDRPVRVEVNVSSGVCSGIVQVIGLLVKVTVEHEFAQLKLDIKTTGREHCPESLPAPLP